MPRFFLGVLVAWLVVIGLIIHDEQTNWSVRDPSDHGKTEIVFWHAMSEQLGRVLDDLIGRFNASQAKYRIRGVPMGNYDTLQKKLLASLVARNAPDMSQNYESLTRKFIKHRKIVCIEDRFASDVAALKPDLIPALLANNTYDGKMWSFPFNKSVPVMFVNREILRRFGYEQPPRTVTELASAAERISAERDQHGIPKIYGLGFTKNNVWMYECRVLQFGGRLTNERGTEADLDSQPAREALAWYQMMLRNGWANQYQGYEQQNDFSAGKVAMIEATMVSKIYMAEKLNFDWAMTPLPGAATDAVILSGTNVNIFDHGNSEKIAGAWEFIKFLADPEVSAEWSLRTTYMPVRQSSLVSPRLQEEFRKDPLLEGVYGQLPYCYFEPRLTHWFECRDMMADALEAAFQDLGPPETYLAPLDRSLDQLLTATAEPGGSSP